MSPKNSRGASPRRPPHRRRSRGPASPAPLRRGAPLAHLLRRWVISAAVLGVTLWATAGLLLAQQPQDTYQPVRPGELQEALPAAPLVFAAYAFVWVALVVYVFVLWKRLSRVERELADVTARLHSTRRP